MACKLSSVIDVLPGLVWTALPDGRVDFVNRAWREYAGLSLEAARDEGWQAIIHPEDLAQFQQGWRDTVARTDPCELTARLRRADGQYLRFVLSAQPVVNAAGEVLKWSGLNRCIDDRMAADELDIRRIADSISGSVVVMTPTGELEYSNRQAVAYRGISLAEQRNWKTASSTIHPDDLPSTIAAWTHSVQAEEPFDAQYRIRRADGVYRWFHVRGLPVRDERGHITRWFILDMDIHDRKLDEQLLAGEKRLLAMMAGGATLASMLQEICRLAESMLEGSRCNITLAEPRQPPPAGHEDKTWSVPITSGNSTVVGVLSVLHPHSPEPAQHALLARFAYLAHSVIEGARWETALRQSEATLNKAQRLSQTGTFSWRVPADEVICSEEIYRICEFEPNSAPTFEAIRARAHPDDMLACDEVFQLSRHGRDFEHEYRLLMPDGRVKHVRLVAHATPDEQGALEYIVVLQDITQWRLSEEALGKVRSELAHVARVASLGALTASIAHEVNQPLAGIITNANTCLRMLGAEPPNVDGARETARRTIRDGNRAADVIQRLRALFSKQALATERVDLNEAAREVIAMLLGELQRHSVILQPEFAGALPSVKGDRVQLQQVVLNLIVNACDAMQAVSDRPHQLTVRSELDELGRVQLSVRDNGPGFAEQDRDRLFHAFYTTKSTGMGVGLSVSRSIIESHGGQLWAVANDGPGASFCFALPVWPQADGGIESMSACVDCSNPLETL